MEIRYKILTNRKIIKPHVDYLSRLKKKKHDKNKTKKPLKHLLRLMKRKTFHKL